MLFCSNDEMSIGVIKYLTTHGFNLPEDMKIVSFDNIEMSKYIKPSLTTVDINRVDWARCLGNIMITLLENKEIDYSKFIPKYSIIRRESF